MSDSTGLSLAALLISVISLGTTLYTMWIVHLRRGRLKMTRPTIIFFGYDTVPRRRTPKIFLRTLLYSTSARGQVIETMYVEIYRDGSGQTFSFWGYGETNKLTAGGGLFVGQTGIALNHHFVLSAQKTDYEFVKGQYSIHVFARVPGQVRPILLNKISIELSRVDSGTYLAGGVGILFELEWDTGKYIGREYSLLTDDDASLNPDSSGVK